jgi:hypothetical protein
LKEDRHVGVQLQSLEILITDGGVYTPPLFGRFGAPEKERNRVQILWTFKPVWSSRRGNSSYGYYGSWNVTPYSLVDNYSIIPCYII